MSLTKLSFTFALLAALGSVACGGGDDGGEGEGPGGLGGGTVCEQACAKLEQCSPNSTCTVNGGGACDGKAAEISQCILDKPCGETNACLLGGG
ncbi:MAG: hypothetical protein IT377_02435 [Polyangiaceae bacterium]|nr:hypothetical protein [Polyangiaceae bacterium]